LQVFFAVYKCKLGYVEPPHKFLTPWRLGGFGDFRKKNSSFQLPYQHPSSSADCARELFNGSNGSASLVDRKPAPPGKKFFLSAIY